MSEPILKGDLAWVHVSGVLHLLEVERLSGLLALPEGRVDVREGQLCDVRFGREQGLDALVGVLGLEEGRFEFAPAPVGVEPFSAISPAVVRCGEALDGWFRLARCLVEVDAAVRAEQPLLALLDGTRTVSEALVESGGPLVRTVEAISDVLYDGRARLVTDDAAFPTFDGVDIEEELSGGPPSGQTALGRDEAAEEIG